MLNYILTRIFFESFRLIPFRMLYIISDISSFVLFRIFRYRKNVIFENLEKAFPEKSKSEINVIAHTHSPYATAFAAAEKPIPVLFTETAEEFGGEIPLSEFVLIGDEAIGEQVVRFGSKAKAVVLRKHGIFSIGATPEKAVDLAILAENSAFTAWLSIHLGPSNPLSEKDIQALYYRQQNVYGQN